MALDPFVPPGRHKADEHMTTFVVRIHTAECEITRTLLEAYEHGLPPKLQEIFEQFLKQMPKPKEVK